MDRLTVHRTVPGPPVPPGTGPPRSWVVLGGPSRLGERLRRARVRRGAPAVAVVLGDHYGPDADRALLRGLALRRTRGWPLALLHRGAGGGSLLRTAALEEPGPPLATVELTAPGAEDGAVLAARAALGDDGGGGHRDLLVDGDGLVSRLRWRPAALPEGTPPVGPVLVTGGLGGLGLRVAAVLAASGATEVVLLDVLPPAGLSRADAAVLARLRARVPGLRVLTVDVTRRGAVARALGGTRPATVVHCSGRVAGGPVSGCAPGDLAALREPKVAGLENVLAALPPGSARALVCFGSVTAHRPHRSMGAYGLANEVLRRRALALAPGLPGCAVVVAEWSLWSGAGQAHRMGVVPGAARRGMPPIPLRAGLDVVTRLLAWPRGPEHATALLITPAAYGAAPAGLREGRAADG
ncbi:KR domain-containing protein [Streptomyces sp. JNUCC 64]